MYYYAHHVGPEADRHRRDVFKVGRCKLKPVQPVPDFISLNLNTRQLLSDFAVNFN